MNGEQTEIQESQIFPNRPIGLALGGGAVLGAAHIGVVRAIEELQIPVGWVSGTSIGSLIGTLFAFGKSAEEIEQSLVDLSWWDLSTFSLSKYGLLSNRKVKQFIRMHIGDRHFEDACVPLAVVATDLVSGEKVVLRAGDLCDAVMASMSIPGVFSPVRFGGRLLVDGGVVENVPIRTLREMGADFTIGVDVNNRKRLEKPGNIIQVLANSFHFLIRHASEAQISSANIMIRPDLSEFNWVDTKHAKQLINLGYQEAIRVLTPLLYTEGTTSTLQM